MSPVRVTCVVHASIIMLKPLYGYFFSVRFAPSTTLHSFVVILSKLRLKKRRKTVENGETDVMVMVMHEIFLLHLSESVFYRKYVHTTQISSSSWPGHCF